MACSCENCTDSDCMCTNSPHTLLVTCNASCNCVCHTDAKEELLGGDA
jgi:hypothetical protein